MKVGDLVWHVDDIKDEVPTPGIVMRVGGLLGVDAVVQFTDRGHEETHPQYELIVDLDDREENENIMGNPDASTR